MRCVKKSNKEKYNAARKSWIYDKSSYSAKLDETDNGRNLRNPMDGARGARVARGAHASCTALVFWKSSAVRGH